MMTANPSRQVPESSLSNPTVVSERSDAVLALGKKLIRELKLGTTTDTLSRWMVHYLAELIKEAEKKSVKNRAAAIQKCFDAILALWQHRHELPDGSRPFQELEPMLRALRSLDPSISDRRYFPFDRPSPGEGEESKATREWLALADGLDYSARILVRHCLIKATKSAIDKSREWVVLAEEVGMREIELPLLKIIIAERELNGSEPVDEQRKLLEDRLGKLRGFLKFATAVATDYERQLKQKKPKTRASKTSSKVPRAPRLARPERVVIVTDKPRRRKTASKV